MFEGFIRHTKKVKKQTEIRKAGFFQNDCYSLFGFAFRDKAFRSFLPELP